MHNNGVTQPVSPNVFTKVNFSTMVYDTVGKIVSSAWTPPRGRMITLIAGAYMPMQDTTKLIATIYKNGAEFKRGDQVMASASDNGMAQVVCSDIPNGTDVYEFFVFHNMPTDQNVSGNPALTYFQGICQ